MLHAHHPIWKTINVAVITLCAGFVLWLNASHFDETEWKALGQLAIALGGWQGIQHVLDGRKAKRDREGTGSTGPCAPGAGDSTVHRTGGG